MKHRTSTSIIAVRGVLSDCDGVLVDSLWSVDRTWHRFAVELDPAPGHVLRVHHGRPARATTAEVAPHRVVFEDSPAGIVAGRAAGSAAVQVQADHAVAHGDGVPLIADLEAVEVAVTEVGTLVPRLDER